MAVAVPAQLHFAILQHLERVPGSCAPTVPIIDLSLPDRTAAGKIREACIKYGFFISKSEGLDAEASILV